MRRITLTAVALLLAASTAGAQEWATKMFKDSTTFNFGTVAKAAKTEHDFEFYNPYVEDIHVAGVRASCGCTSVEVVTPTLKTYQTGTIKAIFNTHLFTGQHGATLTVSIDRPYYAEVQLQVNGYIRDDVQVVPGSVQMGQVEQGQPAMQQVAVNHNGGSWQIVDVRSSNPHIKAQAIPVTGAWGQTNYNLVVQLDSAAPAGYFRDNLQLVDGSQQSVPVLVEGQVLAAITVSPSSLFMGVLQPGQSATKQLVVQGSRPFRIKSITCNDPGFKFNTDNAKEAKTVHLVPVTYKAVKEGKISQPILIETELGRTGPIRVGFGPDPRRLRLEAVRGREQTTVTFRKRGGTP